MKKLFALSLIALCGCAVIKVDSSSKTGTNTTQQVITTYLPAYPWYDISQTVKHASSLQKTNYSSVSLSGSTQDATINTNALSITFSGLGEILGAAVKNAK